MPYLAFDFDAMDRAPNVGRAAGISEEMAIAGMARMWRHCWNEKTDQVDAVAVKGFFGTDATAALVSFRFLEPLNGGFRVRGAIRYLRIRAARSKGGKNAHKNLKNGSTSPTQAGVEPDSSPGSGPALTSSIEHRTSNIKETTTSPRLPEGLGPEAFEPDAQGNFREDAWGCWGWKEFRRNQASLHGEGRPPDNWKEWHDGAVAEVGVEGICLAYSDFLNTSRFGPNWPIAVFMSDAVWRSRTNKPKPKRVRL